MNWKIILAIIVTNVVLSSASYTMLTPFLPIYLIRELGVNLDDITIWSGAIFSISFFVGAILAPFWGRLADKRGKKLMAVRAGACLSIVYFLGGCVTSPEQLFGVRILQGMANGLWPANLAIISATVPKQKLGLSLGILQAAQTVGTVLGPLLGGFLAEFFGMRTSFFLGGGVLAFVTLILLLVVPAPPIETKIKETSGVLADLKEITKNPSICIMLGCTLVVQLVMMILQPLLTIYISELQNTMENIMILSGIVFSISGIAGVISAPLWGKYGQQRSFLSALYYSMAGAGFFMVMQYFASNLLTFSIFQFLLGTFIAGINPSISAMLVTVSEKAFRSRIFGAMTSAQQIGAAIGPLIGGAIGTYMDIRYIFIFAGGLLIINSLWVWMHFNKKTK